VFSMPYSARFTTSGPMVIDSMKLSVGTVVPGTQAILSLKLANRGQERLIPKVRAFLESVDTLCTVGKSWRDFGDVAAGSTSSVWGSWIFRVLPTCPEGRSVRVALSVSSDGYTYWSDTASVYVGSTGVEEPHPEVLPVTFCMEQNYPNPFNPATTIRYGLPRRAQVRLRVFNTLGQTIATLVEGEEVAGYHEVKFDGGNLPSGLYFYRLEAGGFIRIRTMLLLK